MFSVHTTPEKFEYGGYTLKTHQMFIKCFQCILRRINLKNGGNTMKTQQMFSVHTEKFENGYTLKTHQMFSVHTTPDKSENATFTGHLRFVFE